MFQRILGSYIILIISIGMVNGFYILDIGLVVPTINGGILIINLGLNTIILTINKKFGMTHNKNGFLMNGHQSMS